MKRLLSLGDSISIGYRKTLDKYLGNDYEIFAKDGEEEAAKNLNYPVGANCGDSRMLLSYLKDESLHERLNFDIAVFNCGLHDIKYNWMTEKIQVEIDEYEMNLRRICAILKASCKTVYFVNSTPVYDEIHNSSQHIISNVDFVRRPNDIEKYNSTAHKVMGENGILVIDLYGFTKEFGTKAVRDHVHYFPEVEEKQAEFIAEFIKERN
ncbi:MAG: SGNH/GDSL hydrolase family protein [Ruminococcaceae bacterium]|nr:SGNH/GDSL hydrolase family protein [Oscillospiraceae bacterium]